MFLSYSKIQMKYFYDFMFVEWWGIILKKSLPNGKYIIDDDMHLMRFRSGKSEFKVGGQIVFRIEKIDLISQQMFLSIADEWFGVIFNYFNIIWLNWNCINEFYIQQELGLYILLFIQVLILVNRI